MSRVGRRAVDASGEVPERISPKVLIEPCADMIREYLYSIPCSSLRARNTRSVVSSIARGSLEILRRIVEGLGAALMAAWMSSLDESGADGVEMINNLGRKV